MYARSLAPAWSTPTLVLYGGADTSVNPAGTAQFIAAAPSAVVDHQRFKTLSHEIFNEIAKVEPIERLLA